MLPEDCHHVKLLMTHDVVSIWRLVLPHLFNDVFNAIVHHVNPSSYGS